MAIFIDTILYFLTRMLEDKYHACKKRKNKLKQRQMMFIALAYCSRFGRASSMGSTSFASRPETNANQPLQEAEEYGTEWKCVEGCQVHKH